MASSQCLARGQLSKRDLAAIQNYLAQITQKWIDIGVQLEIDPEYLEKLNSDCNSSDSDNLRRMILTWLMRENPLPAWQVLCDALRTPAVNAVEIAKQIEKEKILHASEISEDEVDSGCIINSGQTETDEATTKGLFPYLSTSGLTEKEKYALFERLLQEAMEIRFKFFNLLSNTKTSLLDRGVAVTKISDEMSGFPYQDAVNGVSSIEEAIGVLNETWSFCDYTSLEHIIVKLGTIEDQENLESYKQSLAEYSQRRVFECPEGSFGGAKMEDEEILVVKRIDRGTILHDVTLSNVQDLCHEIRKLVAAESRPLRLISIAKDDQSIEITFGILSSSVSELFPLSQDTKEKFISIGVWYVTCRDHNFQDRHEEVNDEVSEEEEEEEEKEIVQSTSRAPAQLRIRQRSDHEDNDIGSHTSITINNQKLVVEVNNSSSSQYKSYKVGQYRKGSVAWLSGVRGIRYGIGKAPKIALSGKYVVEVDEESEEDISYRVGVVHTATNMMLWTESSVFSTGSQPSVAICHKTVVVGFTRHNNAFYRVGTLDIQNRSVSWSTQEHRFYSGISEFAISSNSDCTVAAVYTKPSISFVISPLYASIGVLDKSQEKIFFSSAKTLSQSFSAGISPSVGLNRNNDIIIVSTYQKSLFQKNVRCVQGLITKESRYNNYKVKWSVDEDVLDVISEKASVAVNDKGTVLISYANSGRYYCLVGKMFHETTV